MKKLLVFAALAASGCRGGDAPVELTRGDASILPDGGDAGPDAGGCNQPVPLTLDCPEPGTLPFEVEAEALSAANAGKLDANPEFKTRNFDVYGLPDAEVAITGRAARGRQLMSVGLSAEPISLWTWNGCGRWDQLARTETDGEGYYAFEPSVGFGQGTHLTYAVLEGDQTCARHGVFLWPRGTKVVLTDIDGTLTISDQELFTQIGDSSYSPKAYPAAVELINAWRDKGYRIIYLTARPHDLRALTDRWLQEKGFPLGPVITADSLVFGDSARTYKAAKIRQILEEFEWSLEVVYGNATSDIEAYADNDLPTARTFIIGENAGVGGTTAIQGETWQAHLDSVVQGYAEASPAPVDEPYSAE